MIVLEKRPSVIRKTVSYTEVRCIFFASILAKLWITKDTLDWYVPFKVKD